MRLRHLLPLLLTASACRTRQADSTALDAGIVPTPVENQRGTAFCWAYAIVAHLEQRFYEATRGASGGGLRLNFSEEYLGLAHLTSQLMDGRAINEGRRLSDSLALVERYGIVPEKVGERTLFKPLFDEALAPLVADAAVQHWTSRQEPEGTPVAAADALKLVSEAARLSEEQLRFLAAAMGHGPAADATFRYANGTYSPQTWAKNRLSFSAADYHVVKLGDPSAAAYQPALQVVKKALLHGYSVPISFNIVRGSFAEGGKLGCRERDCWDAELAVPTPEWPHANHAVLLIDYRSDKSTVGTPTADALTASFAAAPTDWIIKNSWGFNANTSADPELLKRFPLPAFTVMTQEFFAASHRLAPGRYEALVPKEVCLRELSTARPWTCKPLIKGDGTADLALDAPLILGNRNLAALSRYPVELDADAPELPEASPVMKLADAPEVSLARETRIEGRSGETVQLCTKVAVDPAVKYVAMYVDQKTPTAVLSPQSDWQYCTPVLNETRALGVVLQALDDRYRVKGQIKARVTVAP